MSAAGPEPAKPSDPPPGTRIASRARGIGEVIRLWRFLWPYARPDWRVLTLTLVFTVIYGGITALRAYLGGGVVEIIANRGKAVSDAQRQTTPAMSTIL